MIKDTTLVLDKQKVLININETASKADKNGIEFRPHFKTHQSIEIGKWFRKIGVQAITVSSIKMAEYFAKDNWNSITVAFPVNILEIKRINDLASSIDLRILATSIEVLKKLDDELTNQLGIYIEIDPGYGRSGIPIKDLDQLQELKDYIDDSKNLNFEGFYTHAGHSYRCRSKKEIKNLNLTIFEKLRFLKNKIDAPICFGDTPSCSVLNDFGPVDQISPGNLVFYDWTQFNIGSCSTNEIAVAMYCPVVAKYPDRNELLIHGGAVHFSKESYIEDSNEAYFGIVAKKNNQGWGKPLPGNILRSISQEHGVVSCTPSFFNETNIGDVIAILPIHSCLTADLMGEYITLDGDLIDHMNQKVFR